MGATEKPQSPWSTIEGRRRTGNFLDRVGGNCNLTRVLGLT